MASFGATLVIGHHFYFSSFLHRTPRFPTQNRIHFLGKKKKTPYVGRTLPSSGRRLCITESPCPFACGGQDLDISIPPDTSWLDPADTPQTP
ncbi:hypothetical protein CEXT_451821 [Caerostris extrusa]|uniref:Uncharacterized protein n=1 Tax=Caerostris extrusa TaxID=172846 RepID=A0AAV4PAF5_CAEEX|nr:hypothetical protein CEXT_451821 [Caerostris extrusa]